MFRGVTHLALDNKGRLAVPAKHRGALTGDSATRVVLTADPSHCLLLYPLDEWEPIQARLMALSSFNERIRSLQRLLVGHADDVELDSAGRILVPPALRQYASLDKQRRAGRPGQQVRTLGRRQVDRADRASDRRSPPADFRPSSTVSLSET